MTPTGHFGMLGNNIEVTAWARAMSRQWHGCSCNPEVLISRCESCTDVQQIDIVHEHGCPVRGRSRAAKAWLN